MKLSPLPTIIAISIVVLAIILIARKHSPDFAERADSSASSSSRHEHKNTSHNPPRSARNKTTEGEERQQTVLKAMRELEAIDLDPKKHGSYDDYYQDVNGKVSSTLADIDDPITLKLLFWRCHQQTKIKQEPSQDKLTWINIHAHALTSIMDHLSKTKTPDAAEIVVNLYFDSNVAWDGEAALTAWNAVIRCGKAAIPFLQQVDTPQAKQLIRTINSTSKPPR